MKPLIALQTLAVNHIAMSNSSDIFANPPSMQGAPAHHIGAELRAQRLALGLSPEKVGAALKIQASYIRAIEALDTDALPAIGYALGYVRAYAGHLGLDGAQAVARYKADSATPEDLGRRKMPHFVPKTKIRLPRGLLSALTVLACGAVITFWYGSNTPTVAAPDALTDMLDEASYGPAPLPEDSSVLTLKALAPSWVQVSGADGRPVMSRIMITGETWSTDEERLTLAARDGGAIELYAGQERIGVFGEKGVAFTGRPLAASTIRPAPEDTPLENPQENSQDAAPAMTPIKTE